MTSQQQAIINALTEEFNRINSSVKTKSYNLINSSALQEENNREREFAELSKKDASMWELAAYAEMERIIKLLEEDLPSHVVVERYDANIGKYKRPSIQLRHESVHPRADHSSAVSIHICVKSEYRTRVSGGKGEKFGVSLYYQTSAFSQDYATIEDLVSDDVFITTLRNKVIR